MNMLPCVHALAGVGMYMRAAVQRRLAKQLARLHSSRYAVQPLRLGAVLSPRYHSAIVQLHLASAGGVWKPGGPWMRPTRVDPEASEDWMRLGRVFNVEKSIWAPRKRYADSKDYYDTPEVRKEHASHTREPHT